MTLKDIQVAAFDCDGVMFDTLELNRAYYNQLLSHFGLPLMTDAQLDYVHMQTVDISVAYLFDRQKVDEVHAYRKTLDYRSFLKYMRIEPNLKPLLHKLRPHYKTAVATNRTDTMPFVLKAFNLSSLFDLVVTAQDVAHPKPHPDALYKICDYFNCAPANVVYIGDSEVDQFAAQAAAMPFIAYNNRSLQADYHIRSLGEVKTLLAL